MIVVHASQPARDKHRRSSVTFLGLLSSKENGWASWCTFWNLFVSLMTYWLPPVIWTATIFQHWSSYNCIRRTIRLFLQSQSRKEFLQLDMKESTVKVNIINIYGGIFWYKLKFFNVVKFIKEKTPATDWEGLTVPHNHQRKYIQHLRRIPRSIGKNTQNIQ